MRVALITGGMGGLGESISTKMHTAGYRVVVTHSPGNTRVKDWLGEHSAAGRELSAYAVDVADIDSCRECVERVTKDIGPIDILVNNAGITKDTTFKKMSKADWDAVIHTNLDSVFNMTKQVMDGMTDRGWGRVINVSSVNGSKGAFGQTNYSAAKAGMHGFTKALALELDSKILPQIPLGRLGAPDEIAGLIIYLCSEEAAFVTGANIAINGGQHMQ